MNKQRKARLITLLVLAFALVAVVARRSGTPFREVSRIFSSRQSKAERTPQDVIYSMLDAAREGDVERYVAAYTGRMEASLKQAIAEKTDDGFARYLRESNAAVKGIAITEPQPFTDREVRVRVEYVYQDRNEAQFMYLERVAGTWKIHRVDTAERLKTLTPYGTPVE
jgi:hypothetical protein